MISVDQLRSILQALPDPSFILSRSGKYVEVFGGRDTRYYHDGKGLIGLYIADLIKPDKANWFLQQIATALDTRKLLIAEYELSNKDVKGLPDEGPQEPIWFEGRIQALDFLMEGEQVVLWVASNISERHSLESRLRELSNTDPLTGLFNRRKFEHEVAFHYGSWQRYAIPTSIVMFDLDNLKQLNDARGHYAGDELIRTAADICRTSLRSSDVACRFGGDEFGIALPNTGCSQAMELAGRLHRRFKAELARFMVDGVAVTASMGVTAMLQDDASYEDTLRRADTALYAAKSQGKDRIVPA